MYAPLFATGVVVPPEVPKLLLCWPCSGKGLVALGKICIACDGVGAVPRFSITLPVLLIAVDDPTGWSSRRVVVLSVIRDDDHHQVVVHGVNETGEPVIVAVDADRLEDATTVNLEEVGSWL